MAEDFLGYELEEWLPTLPQVGPPLPRFLDIYWPWYAPPAAEFKVSNLIISPLEVNPGQAVTISAKVTNIGTEAGDYTVKLAGDFTGEETVTLEPGASRRISFEVVPDVAKTYHVSVDSLTGTFRATEAPVEIVDFNLTKPTVSPETITPGTAITITCPVTSACTNPQTVTAKVIIYEGSILPGHGSVIATKTSPSFSIAPGQTYNVDVHHTAVAGTIDRRDIEVEVYVGGKLIKESEWDDVYYVEKPALPEIVMDLPLITITDIDGIPIADFRYAPRTFGPGETPLPSHFLTYYSLLDLAQRHEQFLPYMVYSLGYQCRTYCRELYDRLLNLRPDELTKEMITWSGFDKVLGESYWCAYCKRDFFRQLSSAASTMLITATPSEPIVMEELRGITLHGISDVPDLEARGYCWLISKEDYPHYDPFGPPVYYPITSTWRAIGGRRQPDGTINIMFPAPVFHVAFYPGIYHFQFRMLLVSKTFGVDLGGGQINDAVELRIGGEHP